MDYFRLGFGEIGRKVLRQITRARIARARSRRAKALTELGLLGWQQADFDADTQRQVDEIQNVEREQSRHINLSAEVGGEIRRLISEREVAQRTYAEARKGLEAEMRKAVEAKALLERQVAAKRKVEPNFERHIPDLDRELREVTKLYSELLMQERQTPKIKQELIRLRERTVAIPNEKSDLRTQHLRAVTELRTLEDSLNRQTEATTAAQQRMQYAESQWQVKDTAFAAEIKAREKDKANAERQMAALESAKSNPYQSIGEVLAASGIAPVNQPHTLEAVRKIDVEIALLEGSFTDSEAASALEDPKALRLSVRLSGAAAGAAALFLAWVLA